MSDERPAVQCPSPPPVGLGKFALLLLAALMVAQIGVYAWMSRRGFEYTDEAFYLLSYLYWDSAVASFTFFGAFLKWPFKLLGEDVSSIRMFSLVLLMGSSTFFMASALRFLFAKRLPANLIWATTIAAACSSLYYFGHFSTLRAPSYNLMALACMLLATGLLLYFVRQGFDSSRQSWPIFLYGTVVAACVLNKVSTGGLLLICHAVFMTVLNEDWSLRRLKQVLVFGCLGAAFPFLLLHLSHPAWYAAFQEGVAWAQTTDPSYGVSALIKNFRWDLQRQLITLWPVGAMLGFLTVFVARNGAFNVGVLGWLCAGVVSACAVGLISEDQRHHWWLLVVMAWGALMLTHWIRRSTARPYLITKSAAALHLLLIMLPLVFSFGTNGRVLVHSFAAAVFAVSAVLLALVQLYAARLIGQGVLVLGLTVLTLPPLVFQLKAVSDVGHTYRQLVPLGQQLSEVQLGSAGRRLMVSEDTKTELTQLIETARSSGFTPGALMHDFTGDGSGIVYALGARPLATAWTGGGYPGSHRSSWRLLSRTPEADLRASWLLTSDNNPRSIVGWQELVARKLGEANTHDLVATIRLRANYRWIPSAPEYNNVSFWKPRARLSVATTLYSVKATESPLWVSGGPGAQATKGGTTALQAR